MGSSSTLNLSLNNTGGANLTLNQATSSNAAFTATGINMPLTLTPGQSVTVQVTFAPAVAGNVSGTLTLVSTAANSPINVALSGSGTPPPGGRLTPNPTSLSFGVVNLGSSLALNLSLRNTGGASLTINQATSSNTAFTTTGLTVPLTLTPGQSVTVQVTFAPVVAGNVSDTLTLVSTAANSRINVALTATGANPGNHSVGLAWDSPGDPNIVGYLVYRGTLAGGPYNLLTNSLVTDTSYTDSTVAGGQTYFYVVTSVTNVGIESLFSSELSVVIPSP